MTDITIPTTDAMLEAMTEALAFRRELTTPALVNVMEHYGLPVEGTYQIHVPNRPNSVLWAGLSERAAHDLSLFLGRNDVMLNPVSGMMAIMIYSFDGDPILNLPVIDGPVTSEDFGEPHWIPLVVKPAPAGQQRPSQQEPVIQRVAFTRQDKVDVWNKSHGFCWYCGQRTNPFEDFTIDHVHPVADGGTNEIANLVPCCRSCNSSKHDMNLEVFRQRRGGGLFWFEVAKGAV